MPDGSIIIWYDSKRKLYQSGSIKELEAVRSMAGGEQSIRVVSELENTSTLIIDRLLDSLNATQHPDQ